MPVLPQRFGVPRASIPLPRFNLNRDARSSSTQPKYLFPVPSHRVSISTEMPVLPQPRRSHHVSFQALVSISTEMPVLPQRVSHSRFRVRGSGFNLNRDARSSSTQYHHHSRVASSEVSISTEMPVLPQLYRERAFIHGVLVSISTEMPVLPQPSFAGDPTQTRVGFQSQPRCPFFLNAVVRPLSWLVPTGFQSQPRCPFFLNMILLYVCINW